MDINKISYNRITERWADSRNKSSPSKFIIGFSSKIKPNGKILDIGCGTGYPIIKYFSDNGFSITGIDISENMIKKAIEQDYKNATFHLCDFFEYEPIEKYDGIVAYDSFFHFPKEKQKEIYKIVSNWINIGGYFLFTHGNEDGEIEGNMFGEKFYYSSLNTKEVHKLLLEYGFEIEMSIEKYKDENMDIDLVIMARKII
ncbi:MAG: class I SAM-dependent methyltransferase [Treponema sp.]|jgi:predicted TPR repeat methyltransferase|nr:class I SAM-dependent methyltransferase [Treponema sp.]